MMPNKINFLENYISLSLKTEKITCAFFSILRNVSLIEIYFKQSMKEKLFAWEQFSKVKDELKVESSLGVYWL